MFFGRYDERYTFIENKEEIYFNGCDVTSFFEYGLDKFIIFLRGARYNKVFYIIDRCKAEV